MARAPARLAITLAVAVSGCGLLGEPPFEGLRIAHVAPWEDVGPVVICLDHARLAPSLPAGLCATGAPRSCAAGCASRERCICGSCRIPRCDTDEECASEQVCTVADGVCDRACSVDADCAAGEQCVPGTLVCRGLCGADAECQFGERCDGGRCAPVSCAIAGACPGGGTCDLQRASADLRRAAPMLDPAGGRFQVFLDGGGPIFRARPVLDPASVGTVAAGALLEIDATRVLPGDGRAPSVIAWHGAPLMVFTRPWRSFAGAIFRATSSDGGASFTVDPDPVLAPGAPWEGNELSSPSLTLDPTGDGLLLYYATGGGDGVGLATSSDGIHYTALAAPVLTPERIADPAQWRQVDRIASPWAESARDPSGQAWVRLWFSAHGAGDPILAGPGAPDMAGPIAPADDSIGEAASLDGRSFVPWPYGPVFDRTLNFRHAAELDPAVLSPSPSPTAPRLLYYRAASPDGTRSTGLRVARAPAPVH